MVWACFRGPPADPGEPYSDNPAVLSSAGTMHMSMADWAKFVQIFLLGGSDLLSPDTVDRLLPMPDRYYLTMAMGWMRAAHLRGVSYAMQGSNTMWSATAIIDDDRRRRRAGRVQRRPQPRAQQKRRTSVTTPLPPRNEPLIPSRLGSGRHAEPGEHGLVGLRADRKQEGVEGQHPDASVVVCGVDHSGLWGDKVAVAVEAVVAFDKGLEAAEAVAR